MRHQVRKGLREADLVGFVRLHKLEFSMWSETGSLWRGWVTKSELCFDRITLVVVLRFNVSSRKQGWKEKCTTIKTRPKMNED